MALEAPSVWSNCTNAPVPAACSRASSSASRRSTASSPQPRARGTRCAKRLACSARPSRWGSSPTTASLKRDCAGGAPPERRLRSVPNRRGQLDLPAGYGALHEIEVHTVIPSIGIISTLALRFTLAAADVMRRVPGCRCMPSVRSSAVHSRAMIWLANVAEEVSAVNPSDSRRLMHVNQHRSELVRDSPARPLAGEFCYAAPDPPALNTTRAGVAGTGPGPVPA